MRPKQMLRLWFSMLILTLLLLFWFGVLITRDSPSPATQNSSLRGYSKISPHRKIEFLDVHCSHCAVVSSSGQMLGVGAGDEIDRTGCVIRMNNAPTRGYEKDVGNRTTIRVVSHTSVPLLVGNEKYYFKQSASTTYVFWGPKRNMRQDGKGIIFNVLLKLAIKYRKLNMYVLTQDKIEYCDSVFQNETGKNRMKTGAFLSTGFFTMILAMDMCDRISVYGMIDDNYSEPITATFLTITMSKRVSVSAGCIHTTSSHSVEDTASSLRSPSMPNGQHSTTYSSNILHGNSKEWRPQSC
ncbi:alpha-N-acetyl-neuraminyl-2,3-beta-galactosyl-1,3-N-acetyl-galactosaminide alpha-2,6-sialyltransferase isoform X1 [Gambusia affinis]|uniref:alpha-N-acetyl-neuraminyl-2,3-beta-galactosyl-1, 3-N-acetyl-galactosaminide alpha-2,6-sialyltransferase isoform X1 n=1 Tax=Gambusia affinis TaxID=33528 RepID=UPI001CDC910D|nr:alpha-N-acetyl-neuraminyl-2,3-beta-galactosyl-1,3-N-acetyl-galactosaminide alpha-2,6-sialyltransferase isoform X1 [Gambusia affinis]XP_043999877.1 alpha-N-acetyl-neuraminyl-2,3-beta-galactosyl-1,3-N-acetyl-galactosaminide alpha-2,6-sialyltransferase isoform X1 [Gambusia affinis]